VYPGGGGTSPAEVGSVEVWDIASASRGVELGLVEAGGVLGAELAGGHPALGDVRLLGRAGAAPRALDRRTGVGAGAGELGEGGAYAVGLPGEAGGAVGEQPGTALAAAAHHDAVAAGLLHHLDRVLGGPDVAVAEHGDVGDELLELGDRLPARLAGVVLDHGAAVRRDRGGG